MILDYNTLNLNPCPCISVRLNIFPHVNDFIILVVACPACSFFDFAPTAISITGANVFIVGFKNLDQAVSLPSNIFFNVFLNPAPSN